MPKKQFIFTRTSGRSTYQTKLFDLLESWGKNRFDLVTLAFKSILTEEDLDNPEICTGKILTSAQRGPVGSVPTPTNNPVVSTPVNNNNDYSSTDDDPAPGPTDLGLSDNNSNIPDGIDLSYFQSKGVI